MLPSALFDAKLHTQLYGLYAGAGPIVSPIDVAAALDNRDSLAKTLYSRLFDWLVEKINSSIGQDATAPTLVGVLDIYGAAHIPVLIMHTVDGKTFGI